MTAADIVAAALTQHTTVSYPDRVAAAVLDALRDKGYEVVQPSEPESREDGEDEVGSQWECVGEFRVTVWDEYPDEVALSYDFEPYEPFTPAEARSLAAALLAAANRVEGESK